MQNIDLSNFVGTCYLALGSLLSNSLDEERIRDRLGNNFYHGSKLHHTPDILFYRIDDQDVEIEAAEELAVVLEIARHGQELELLASVAESSDPELDSANIEIDSLDLDDYELPTEAAVVRSVDSSSIAHIGVEID